MSRLADCCVCRKIFDVTHKEINKNYDNNTLYSMKCPECIKKANTYSLTRTNNQ